MKSCGVFGPQQPQSKTLTLRQEQVSPAASEWDFLEVIIRHDTVTVVTGPTWLDTTGPGQMPAHVVIQSVPSFLVTSSHFIV